jgi:hypothetical protein
MNKFSEFIRESNTENFVLTDDQCGEYKVFINNLLRTTFSDRMVNIPGSDLMVFEAYDYEKSQMPGREYSILGKVNTNKRLISNIWGEFKIKDFSHLKNFIKKFCNDLFSEKGRFFKSKPGEFSVWDTIRRTEIIGEANEAYVVKFIKEKFGPESNPIREVTSSYKDMVLGIDITFNIDGEEKTCQVKPLKYDNFKERGVVIIGSSGVLKPYKTDYIAFVNPKRSYREKCLFFINMGVVYDKEEQTVTLPYRNLVNKKYGV